MCTSKMLLEKEKKKKNNEMKSTPKKKHQVKMLYSLLIKSIYSFYSVNKQLWFCLARWSRFFGCWCFILMLCCFQFMLFFVPLSIFLIKFHAFVHLVCIFLFIEKLLTSEGRELRRALFSLKQIFQDDKDLVHGFVALGGLNSLVRVGNNADQNYQNYILRALGQVINKCTQ